MVNNFAPRGTWTVINLVWISLVPIDSNWQKLPHMHEVSAHEMRMRVVAHGGCLIFEGFSQDPKRPVNNRSVVACAGRDVSMLAMMKDSMPCNGSPIVALPLLPNGSDASRDPPHPHEIGSVSHDHSALNKGLNRFDSRGTESQTTLNSNHLGGVRLEQEDIR